MRALELLLAAAHRRQRAGARILVGQRGVQRQLAAAAVFLARPAWPGARLRASTRRRDRSARGARPRFGFLASSSAVASSAAAARGGAPLPRRGGGPRPRPAAAPLPRPGGARIPRARGGGAPLPRRGAWRRRRRAGAPRPRGPSSLRARGGAPPSRRCDNSLSTMPERCRRGRRAASALPAPAGAGRRLRRLRLEQRDGAAAGSGLSPGMANLRFLVSTTTGLVRPCEKFWRTVPCSMPGRFSVSVFFGVDAQRLVVARFAYRSFRILCGVTRRRQLPQTSPDHPGMPPR